MKLYVTSVKVYDDYAEKEKTYHVLYPGTSYSNVIEQIRDDFGEEEGILSVCITPVGDGDESGGLSISESLADALINDIPTLIHCTPSEWRCKMREMREE